MVEKSGLNLSPSDNIVGGVDFTTVHSYGATGDSVSGKPSLIVFDSIKNQPTVLFNTVQINSPSMAVLSLVGSRHLDIFTTLTTQKSNTSMLTIKDQTVM